MAEKKKQGPIGMTCVKWHMRNGKPWRCARFRPPEKPTPAKPKRKRKAAPKTTKKVVAKRKPAAKRKPVARRKPKPK